MRDVEASSAPPRPMSFLAALAWTFGAGALTVGAILATAGTDTDGPVDVVNATACTVLSYSVMLFAIVRLYAPEGRIRDVLGMRKVSIPGLVLSTLSAAALSPALAELDDRIAKRFPPSQEETNFTDQLVHMTSLRERAVLFVSFAILLPVFQEIFFRGAIFGGLRRGRAEGVAIVAASTLYVLGELFQGDVRVAVSALVLGLFFSWLRGRSGSLVPPLVAHVVFNAVPLVPFTLGRPDYELPPKIAVACAVGAVVLLGGAGLVLAGDAQSERARLEDG